MSKTLCMNCGCETHWEWEEAFDKFGFGDGDGLVMTGAVAHALRQAGYEVDEDCWGLHNVVIYSIKEGGVELIPSTGIAFGYDDARDYLPKAIVNCLDQEFPKDGEVDA